VANFSQQALLTYAQNRDRPDALLNLAASAAPEPAPQTGGVAAPNSSPRQPSGGTGSNLASWAQSQLGVREGSKRQRYYASRLGLSASLPWCSIFVANGLRRQGKSLPKNPAYSGAWMNWKGGKRVKTSQIRPGDLVIYDWGDGGITDHIAVYTGNGRVVGGNQSNAVTRAPAKLNQAVAVIRPK
jgi:cell wall-associated NlpC family hydrolase